ncbi:MAG: GNAT family N-acetyltransferase [Thermoflexales bacterium]|nr:GNAT family N-acetyltransferase [Thermoflexales bacterium]
MNRDAYTLTVEEDPEPEEVALVIEGLRAYNRSHAGDDDHRKLAVFVRDAQERIVGGLLGDTYWGWLGVSILWIEESHRRQGHGRALLVAAEREAVQRGCQYAHLDTMSFQAIGFYQKLGYRLYGELHDMPAGHSRYFLWKEL